MDWANIYLHYDLCHIFTVLLIALSVSAQSPAKIIQPPVDTRAIAGESVLFFCQAEGNPAPRIVFRWNDVELTHSRPGMQLKVTSPDSISLRAKLENSHNGDSVTCYAQNQVGSDAATAHITVYNANETPPRGFPKVRQDPSATISQVGDSTHLQCDVSADPPAVVSWIKDQFYPVDTSSSRFRLVGSGSLIIETLLETDSGSYECMARNVVGTVLSNSGHLHVRRIQFPPTINEMPDKVEVSPGRGTNLTCRAGGFPVPMVWWSTLGSPAGPRHSGMPVMMTERPLTDPQPHEATLRLTDITESYDYNCIAKNGLGLVRKNVSVIVKELPAPPTDLDARPISGTFAVLWWRPSKSHFVDSYTLSVETRGHVFGNLGSRQVANIDPKSRVIPDAPVDQLSYNLTELTPYTEYVVRVHAVSRSAGLSPPSKPVEFRTAELPPSSPPQMLHASVVSPNSIMVTWKPPLESNGRITGYKVFFTTRPEDTLSSWLVSRTTQERQHLTDLVPNATYYLRANAYNAAGDGPVSESFPVIVTPGDVPSAPLNFRGTSTDPTTIQLLWTAPEMPEGRTLLGYQLRYRTRPQSRDTAGKDKAASTTQTVAIGPEATDYYLKGLEPSTHYYISLAGRTASGQGVAAQIEVATKDYLPDMPQGRKILVLGPQTIQVTWNGPKKRQSEVRHYKLMWKCLDCPPTEHTNVDSSGDTVSLSRDVSRQGQRKVLANEGDTVRQLYTATLGDLLPDSSYQVTLVAANSRGVGQEYLYPIVRTRNQTPMKPLNLYLVSIHKRPRPQSVHQSQLTYQGVGEQSYLSVELAWDPPEGLRTSQQVTYQVYAQLIGPEDLIAELSTQPGLEPPSVDALTHSTSDQYPGSNMPLPAPLRRRLLANVTGNTFRSSESDNIGYGATYRFEVSLLNNSVSGPAATLNVTTPDAAPSTSPLHVRLSGLSSSAVEVSWAPPPVQYRNGRITGYQVRYFEVGAETQTETMAKVTVSGQRQYTAKDLKEKTFYTFMVRAFTSAGPGPWSGASNIRTSVELPPPPLDIRASRINQHQIKVTWRIPTGDELGPGSRHLSILGFRVLYSANNNPYEAGQWTSFDVGPVNMAIISHLESKTSYVICIKSRGQDGRYGDCSQPVISRTISTGSESDFSVRNLLCTGDATNVKVTWQQPIRTKQLEGFKLRVGGSKRFADSSGVMRTLEFPARSVSVAYASIHSGYTYTVSDLEPNSVYDVQLSAYYEMTLDMESNWETTSCYTQMQKPTFVSPPIPVAVSAIRRQVLLQLARVSERFGKIRHYFLVVAPVHLTDMEPEKVDIEGTITASRGLPSTGTRYVAARYMQDYFDPPPRHARNFTLGALPNVQRVKRFAMMPTENLVTDDATDTLLVDVFTAGMDTEINFDNKLLVVGQEYKAFVRACVFQDDQSTGTGPNACTSSDWSLGFGPDRPVLPWNAHGQPEFDEYGSYSLHGSSDASGRSRDTGPFGIQVAGNDLFVIAVVAVIVGLTLVAVICIAFGCFMRRRRRPKLLNHLNSADPTLKQPLMRLNECGSANGTNVAMVTSGIDLVTSNITAQSMMNDKRSSLATGHGSAPGSHILPASSPLLASVTATGRAGAMLAPSATSSPMTGTGASHHLDHSGHLCGVTLQHTHPTSPYNLGQPDPSVHAGYNAYLTARPGGLGPGAGGTLSSNAGSHPSSLTGATSGMGSATGGPAASNLTSTGMTYSVDQTGLNDGLVVTRNGHLNSMECSHEQSFDLQHLTFDSKIPGQAMRHPIPINCLADHVARLNAADNLLFSQEYESIETEQQFTWEHSNLEVNKPKNRYANVIAYDHSRVILQSIDCVPGSDYINANYIDGYKRPNAYIATQGPMPETYSDFWRMIWEQRVFIIVMMTRLEERSRVKCDQYWPTRGPESYASGLLTVTPVDTIELAYYTIRTFNLTARGIDDECREVRHFQFTSWPDHGVPEYPIPLLLFIRRVRATLAATSSNPTGGPGTAMNQTNLIEQGPIVVHCSAGVGRTGAFIVIDMMLERIKYEKTVDIYGCVKALRTQRNFMVQTEDQYVFIHSALLEAIDAGNTEVPARNLLAHIKKLRLLDATGGSGMDLEFKKLQQFRLPRAKYTSAQLACNKSKNRALNALPYESTRVPLQPIRGVEGSDYINASFVDSYRDRKAYIATQSPMAKTVEDFWRMMWELNSNIVVMLTKLVERGRECCYPYWPSERSARYQYYVVDPMVEYNMPNYTLREFKLTDARDGQSRTLRQFQFTDWPEQGVPETCEAFIEFLGQVHKTKEQFGQDGPITVHCSNGIGRTGVFLALSIVLERMRYEGVVDMFQTVRMLRTQRPGLVETEEQYQFCYNSALEYLSSFDHYAT